MLVLEFRSIDFSKVEIVVYSGRIKQNNISVFPVLDKSKSYVIDGKETRNAAEISQKGIHISLNNSYTAQTVRLLRCED